MSVSLVENKWIGQLASLVEKNLHTQNNWKRVTRQFPQIGAAEQHSPIPSTENLSKWKSLRRSSVPAPGAWLEMQLKNVTTPSFDPISAFAVDTDCKNSDVEDSDSSDSILSESTNNPTIPFAHMNHRYLNDFEETACLGRGGFGVVLRARNRIDQTEYAIKRVELEEDDLLNALSEVRVMAALPSHPHIIRYFSSWLESAPYSEFHENSHIDDNDDGEEFSEVTSPSSDHDALYIQMGLCGEGATLAQLLNKRKTPNPGMLNTEDESTLNQILSAVEHMHSNGFEHLDICPRNVFRQDTENWCIGDFSFSRRMGLNNADDQPMGTHLYAAPEISVKTTGNLLCGAADVFSLGILMAEMCLNFDTAMERVVTLEKIKTSGDLPQCILTKSPQLSQLIVQMIAQAPEERPCISTVIRQLARCPSPNKTQIANELIQNMMAARDQLSNTMRGLASLDQDDIEVQSRLQHELSLWRSLLDGYNTTQPFQAASSSS